MFIIMFIKYWIIYTQRRESLGRTQYKIEFHTPIIRQPLQLFGFAIVNKNVVEQMQCLLLLRDNHFICHSSLVFPIAYKLSSNSLSLISQNYMAKLAYWSPISSLLKFSCFLKFFGTFVQQAKRKNNWDVYQQLEWYVLSCPI